MFDSSFKVLIGQSVTDQYAKYPSSLFCFLNSRSFSAYLTLLATAFFFPGCYGGGADSAHHFETLVRAGFEILTGFETIYLMTHQRRPRIQKMKCLAQKLTKWRRIEKLWRKRDIERFSKIERFALCKSCYRPSTKWLSFQPG